MKNYDDYYLRTRNGHALDIHTVDFLYRHLWDGQLITVTTYAGQ